MNGKGKWVQAVTEHLLLQSEKSFQMRFIRVCVDLCYSSDGVLREDHAAADVFQKEKLHGSA